MPCSSVRQKQSTEAEHQKLEIGARAPINASKVRPEPTELYVRTACNDESSVSSGMLDDDEFFRDRRRLRRLAKPASIGLSPLTGLVGLSASLLGLAIGLVVPPGVTATGFDDCERTLRCTKRRENSRGPNGAAAKRSDGRARAHHIVKRLGSEARFLFSRRERHDLLEILGFLRLELRQERALLRVADERLFVQCRNLPTNQQQSTCCQLRAHSEAPPARPGPAPPPLHTSVRWKQSVCRT